jgi:hypothetical protein
MIKAARTALIVWAVATVVVALSVLWIDLRLGAAGLSQYIQQPPLIDLSITLASVALVWLSAGALLMLVMVNRVNRANALSVAGFFLVAWVYFNILPERVRYGDYGYYFDAASKLHAGQPLPPTYFYLPFWATITQFLAPLGEHKFFVVLWLLNALSLAAFYVLLHLVLQRYGFNARIAAIVTTLFMLANAPLLRTLVYVQVNLHALNFILLSLLIYPRHGFLSAFSLALAVHLKTSPAILALAFLLEMDWRWLVWFLFSLLIIAGVTVVINGFPPFLDALHNAQALAASQNTIFHDTSFDSFLRFTGRLLQLGTGAVRSLIYLAKALLFAATGAVMLRCIRFSAFVKTGEASRLLNAIPPLLVFMTLASPIVWEHHAIFLALPFTLLLKRLELPADWLLFFLAYLLEFLLPTFDFYPWSFGRLLAPLLVLLLMWRTSQRAAPSSHFETATLWLDRLTA